MTDASMGDGSPDPNGSVPPLASDNLPELMDITDIQALQYVTQLLQQLMTLHEQYNSTVERRERIPSFEAAVSESDEAVLRLVPAKNFAASAGSGPGEAETVEPAVEFQHAMEHYKRFWLKEVPSITIAEYLQRFHRYCRSSAASYLTAGRLIYLVSVDRRIIPVTQRNVYRLFCAAFMVAVKFIEDTMYPMSRYATTAGLKKSDLSRLEITFLLLANYDVKVDREMLKAALKAWAELNASSDIKDRISAAQQPSQPVSSPPISAA